MSFQNVLCVCNSELTYKGHYCHFWLGDHIKNDVSTSETELSQIVSDDVIFKGTTICA